MAKFPNWIHTVVSILGGWWSTMSGALSIPFACLALFLPSTTAKALFAILAYVSLFATALTMALNHQKENKKHAEEIQKISDELAQPKMTVHGELVIEHTHRLGVFLRVRAVNLGTRPVRIRKVAVAIRNSPLPIPEDASAALASVINNENLTSSELCLFGCGSEPSLELPPDGGDCEWSGPIKRNFEFAHQLVDGKQMGTGYVMLTSGTKLPFNFVPLEQWPLFLPDT
jgi:hypothetical protein